MKARGKTHRIKVPDFRDHKQTGSSKGSYKVLQACALSTEANARALHVNRHVHIQAEQQLLSRLI